MERRAHSAFGEMAMNPENPDEQKTSEVNEAEA